MQGDRAVVGASDRLHWVRVTSEVASAAAASRSESFPEGRGGRFTGQVQSRRCFLGVDWQRLDSWEAEVSAGWGVSYTTRRSGAPESSGQLQSGDPEDGSVAPASRQGVDEYA